MRVLLDHELLTMREAQKMLKINRCELEHLLKTGKLKATCIGSQWKIEGRNLKRLLATPGQASPGDQDKPQRPASKASPYERAVIEEWT